MRFGPRPQPGAPAGRYASSPAAAGAQDHARRLGGRNPGDQRLPDTCSWAGLVLRSRRPGSKDHRLPALSVSPLSCWRIPVHPPTLTWLWRPAPAWREDPQPVRGEGRVGQRAKVMPGQQERAKRNPVEIGEGNSL